MPASETNAELAERFRDAAKVLDLKGETAFKAIAFQKVATALENLPDDVKTLHADGGRAAVKSIKDIGASSAAIICDILETGSSPDHDALMASVPPQLLLMLDVPGMGPKTVKLVWQERGIETLADLAAAIDDGSLTTLKGLGPKKLEQIKEGLAMREAAGVRRSLGSALKTALPLLEQLAAIDGVERVEQAGSVRRGRETIGGGGGGGGGDLDFVLTTAEGADAATILRTFSESAPVSKVLGLGNTKCSVLTDDDLQVDCRVVPSASFGAALCYFTGSKAHNQHLRGLARKRGHNLNEWGLFESVAWEARENKPGTAPDIEPVAGGSEQDIYDWLGLDWVPPELREDTGEIELAEQGKLPALIEAGDHNGDLHCHTHASDGVGSIEEMAEAAKTLGYAFLAITDHSVSQAQANGLDAKRLVAHAEAIRSINDQIDGIELLAGTECDILADGRLDYDDAILAELDWVIASPHAALRQDTKKATDRLLRAIDSSYVNAIGHPTGRLINRRAGLPLDYAAVFSAAAATGTALEINASYQRLDLAADQARGAVKAGCALTINTDAHTPHGLGKLAGGLVTARRGRVTKADVINCWSLKTLRQFIARANANDRQYRSATSA